MSTEVTKYSFDPSELPGATRIGHIWLHVPPININFNNPKFEDQMTTIRQQGPNYIKTGRGMWAVTMDIVFSGTSAINNKMAPIIAMIRRTPLLTIKNETIYKMCEHYTGIVDTNNHEIPVAIQGYSFSTEPDLPDTVLMRLSMLVYNFRPLVNEIQYLKQELDSKGEYVYVPTPSIEGSNLWRQYVNGLIKKSGDFMFQGEVDTHGRLTDKDFLALKVDKSEEFVSRTSLSSRVLRNGDAVCPVGNSWGSAEGNENINIGYHVLTLQEAFDLTLGAYRSRRTDKWVSTEKLMREDVSAHLGIQIAETDSLSSIISENIDSLSDLPMINTSNRYLKLFSISSNRSTSISGLTVRRSMPITVLPIVSAPVPTCQYLGGGTTDVAVSIITNSEAFVEAITAVDKAIETQAREVTRNAGGRNIYIENDVVNLNGTFLINTGALDIQNVPDNPGTFMVNWAFNEQTEVLDILDSKFVEKRNFKKKILSKILDYYGPNWDYTRSQKSEDDPRFVFDDVKPSYTETILIPSMIRLVRNAFIRWLKEGEKWEAEKAIDSQSVLTQLGLSQTRIALAVAHKFYDLIAANPELNIDVLFGKYIGPNDDTAPKIVDPNRPGQGTPQAGVDYGVSVGVTRFSRKDAYNVLWKKMVGIDLDQNHPLYAKFVLFLAMNARKDPSFDLEKLVSSNRTEDNAASKNRAAIMKAGAIQVILNGDCRRFEMMIRSPKLLQWELGLMGTKKIKASQLPQNGRVFVQTSNRVNEIFTLRADILELFNRFKADLKSTYNIDIDIISGYRGRSKNEELQDQGATDVNFENSSHTFGVAVDFSVIQNGKFIARSSVPSGTWDNIGVIARKYFTWGGDFTSIWDPNHVCIKNWSKSMAAKYRTIYDGYYTSEENLLKYGADNTASSYTDGFIPPDIIESAEYISCYSDLGIPFAYQPEDNKGNLIKRNGSLVAPIMMTTPSFYLRHYSPFLANETITSKAEIRERIKSDSTSLSPLTGAGPNVMSVERAGTRVDNGMNVIGYEPPDATNSSKTNKDLSETELDKQMKRIEKDVNTQARALNNQGLLGANTSYSIGTFKNVEELFLSNSLVKSMGSFGSETSPMVIAEAEYEHKLFRSTFKDFNAEIDKTIPNIIEEARRGIRENDKYYDMSRAYPTYKIYFREENSAEWFLFDNFYDYRACDSIRVYREKASPAATAYITLNDYNATLTDLEAIMSKENFNPENRNGENRITNQYTGKPLKKLFLQPGTQIQIKMGYEANPDDLPTVFNGFVTETQPGEKYEVVCQGYGAELFTEADTGSFLGWICPPKSFIWWMLLDSKVKHLGRLVQSSVLPNSARDYLDGSAFDDNIYIDQEMEPGTWRLLQSYNADNMTKWDALQDIAAAHPGFICQVVPFDDRETVYFGRPDGWYKFTQDLGSTKKYMDVDYDLIPALGGGWRSLTQKRPGKSISIRDEFKQAVDKADSLNGPQKEINYLQWIKVKDKIEEGFSKWRSKHMENKAGAIMWNLMNYCQIVEVLATVAADGSTGNCEYWLGLGQPNDLKPIPEDYGLNSKQESPVIPNQIRPKTTEDAEVARLADDIIKHEPAYKMSKDMLENLDPVIRSSVLRGLRARTIPLKTLLEDPDVNDIGKYMYECNPVGDIQKQAEVLNNLQNILSRYDLAKDEKKVKEELNNLHTTVIGIPVPLGADLGEGVLESMKKVYEKYGIESPIVILCWWRLAKIWTNLLEGLPGVGRSVNGTQTYGNAYSLDVTNEVGNKQSFTFSANIPCDLHVRHTTSDIQINVDPNGGIAFSGPIFRTDMKTHIMFRNVLLQNLVDIGPEFQKILAEMGHSPIQERFRKYHLATSYEHIVNNNIKSDFMGMWNRVRLKYKRHDFMDYYIPFLPQLIFGDKPNNEFEIQAGDTLDDKVTRELVMPVENAKTVGQARNYATSILAEGVRNMYTGTLTLLGNPSIKPNDVVYIYDDYHKMYGPIEVKSVNHVMSAESGFISVIEPHAYVDVLSQEIGAASVIKEIFDIAMLALILFPPAELVGAGGTIAAKAAGTAGKKAAQSSAKEIVEKAAANALKTGKQWGGQIYKFVGSKYAAVTEAWETSSKAALKSASLKFMEKKNIGNAEAKILEALNSARSFKDSSLPQLNKIEEAGITELGQAMKKVLGATPNTQLEAEVDLALSRSLITPILSGSGKLAKKGVKNAKGLLIDKEMWESITKISFVNMVKTLAVAGPIGYYQMFAGMDDKNYACPLRITPLSVKGQPFQAGLDGITHRWGIWNHIAGEWRKFDGSVNTVSSSIEEFLAGITGGE